MNTQDFLLKLQEELEEEVTLQPETNLKSLESYDSLALLTIIAFVDENFNKKVEAKHFKDIKTIDDLMMVIGKENFED
jgi:acyl carrier protein